MEILKGIAAWSSVLGYFGFLFWLFCKAGDLPVDER
jgi:hypothetical protein